MKQLLYILTCFLCYAAFGQHKIDINAVFDVQTDQIQIKQYIEYYNHSKDTLQTIYLNDWSNSYATKSTPLARRFTEEFNTKFHFAKSEERGFTVVTDLRDDTNTPLLHDHLEAHPDVIRVSLDRGVAPGEAYKITLNYTVKIPSSKFTRYGVTSLKDYNLKYWYITPAIYDGQWHYFSNKNLDDLYIPPADMNLQVTFPKNYMLTTELDLISEATNSDSQTAIYSGKDRIDTRLFLQKFPHYRTIQTDMFAIVSNLKEKDIKLLDKTLITDKVISFIYKHLGTYPHKKLIVSEIDVKKDPVYGLNQLPDFIRPFPAHFQFELSLLKSTLGNYLDNTLLLNPRKDQWLRDAIQIYFLMKYVEENYPNTKLLGSFAHFWGIRSFHAADINFNEQYNLSQMHMQRTNRDQPLTMAKDSLMKFNKNLANKYKAGVGLKYLDDYINADILENTLRAFLDTHKVVPTSPEVFETQLRANSPKNLDWFFDSYINSRSKIDYKIKNVTHTDDSIHFTIKNKRDNEMPMTLFALRKDSVLSKKWVAMPKGEQSYSIPNNGYDKLVLNYDRNVPEFNLRNNWKYLRKMPFTNKPLQLRVLQDFEDPSYSQVFLMPIVEFNNIYDGLTLGAKLYNKTVLRKNFYYKLAPQYGTKSKNITGSGTLSYIFNFENQDLYTINMGITGGYSSYAPELFARVITPFLRFNFRDDKDFRSNKRSTILARYLDINKDPDIFNISGNNQPDYKVFNLQYLNSNPGLVNFYKWFVDFQVSENFGKLSFNYEYRKLFESNRQLNIRFFTGAFLYNNNPDDLDYFSFALDRPTDYLFDYNYLGRSETTGIYSQQLIIAEGGFKSKLETPFANRWMSTFNLSTTLWKYIQAYGDIGMVKNNGTPVKFVYDSGIRINLVADYFEIYFPVYSNLGWEIAQPNYDEKIRFVFTVDPQTLLGLFRRKWY